jgi:hypothetical protein
MKSTGETRQLGEKPVPVPLCTPQISYGLDLGSNPGLRDERPATNRLSHGTASRAITFFSLKTYTTDIRLPTSKTTVPGVLGFLSEKFLSLNFDVTAVCSPLRPIAI